MWREEHFLGIVQTAIEELRNHYWGTQGIPIEKSPVETPQGRRD